MKAIVWTKYGTPDGLVLREVDKPTPKDNEVLIKVHASTVTAGDSEMRRLAFPFWLQLPIRLFSGLRNPRGKILGQELAGEVAAVGSAVTRFQVGDQVFAATGFDFGGYAEYICLPETSTDSVVAHKPASMSYAEAAAVPVAGLEALYFLSRARVQPGEQVLINGAGGSIGTFGVQLAKHYGATVTAVDSGAKLDMLREIGADHVLDYTREDFTANGARYDMIFDVIGTTSFGRSMRVLKPEGRYLLANPGIAHIVRGRWANLSSSKRAVFGPASRQPADLHTLTGLIEAGHLKTVIDRVYPLAQAAEAHRYVESGQKQGHVVIRVREDDNK